jgi:hypothetical protein
MKIKLNHLEKEVLYQMLKNEVSKHNFFSENEKFYLEIDEDSATDLREQCGNYLMQVGFEENYVANEKGMALENLIDKLYVP